MDYETCPGEEACSTNEETGIIYAEWQSDPDRPAAEICADCKFLPTKPGTEPAHLVPYLQIGNELDAIRASGGTFSYPDGLSVLEWTCLTALTIARNESEAEGVRERKREAAERAKMAELEQARRR